MSQAPTTAPRRWRSSSIAIILAAWAILQIGGLFTPGLLDDVDSVYIQVAREMLQRHDFVTPTIDGIRFFDKPPLMYWMAAGSMHLFGVHDWAARLPLALGVLALLFATYALGIRFYGSLGAPCPEPGTWVSTTPTDRAGLYAALALATCIGPYLYTRFYIPDILIALWMTLSVHLFLIALDRISRQETHTAQNPCAAQASSAPHKFSASHESTAPAKRAVILSEGTRGTLRVPQSKDPEALHTATSARTFSASSPLWPMLGFAAVLALSVLTKGLIGIVFPILFVLFYLAFTHNFKALKKLYLLSATVVFLAIAAPWHVLAALRNPPIAMLAGVGLPSHAGWAWFYLYNEHIARFLGRRIPHDYGQVPIPLFWLLLLLWLLPWVAFLPAALLDAVRTLRASHPDPTGAPEPALSLPKDPSHLGLWVGNPNPGAPGPDSRTWAGRILPLGTTRQDREAALSCLLWAGIILGFFTLSSRQEYYHLPALPALALLVGGLLAAADSGLTTPNKTFASRAALRGSLFFLAPLGSILFVVCGYLALTAPTPHAGVTLNDVLSSNPAFYDLSLGHVFDLTTSAMGFFKGPLLAVALCMLALGPVSHLIRRRGKTLAANLLVAAAMTGVLLAAHEGLVRFYPILGSKSLALAIDAQLRPGDLILIDGELTSGSTLLFYTPQSAAPILLVNGRVNGPWFGSFWPDAPHIFLDDAQLHHLWSGTHRVFLLTYHPARRIADLTPFGPVHDFAISGGKTILTNQTPPTSPGAAEGSSK